jgi:hypothetical protein
LFGDRFRVTFEESYWSDLGQGVHRDDPWLQIIECRDGRGHFFPWSGAELAVSVDKGKVAERVAALGCCRKVQDGDGVTFTFALADFERVAEIMKPRMRRHLSVEQRAENAQRLQQSRVQRARREGSPSTDHGLAVADGPSSLAATHPAPCPHQEPKGEHRPRRAPAHTSDQGRAT